MITKESEESKDLNLFTVKYVLFEQITRKEKNSNSHLQILLEIKTKIGVTDDRRKLYKKYLY